MKALVTGGGGFLGKALVRRLLQDGHDVRSFARGDYPELQEMGAESQRGDLADAQAVTRACTGCDIVFHVAAKAGNWGPYEIYHRANVVGTQNVLAACQQLGIGKLVYTSSPSVVHGGGDIEGGDESLPYPERYHAHYPKTKAMAERMVLAANSPHLATVSLRPHLIWGPGDRLLAPRFVERAQAGKLRLIRAPGKKVDGVYVENAVDAHIAAAERLEHGAPCAGKAYFITNDEPIAAAELINAFVTAAGLPPGDKYLSPSLAWWVALLMELAYTLLPLKGEPLLTRFVAEHLTTSHWYDISAARRDLGYAPRVKTDEGLKKLKQWFEAGSP